MMEGAFTREQLKLFFEGNPLCAHKIDDFVVKSKDWDKKFKHQSGTMGVVKGSWKAPDGMDCYLVDFGDGPNHLTFIIGTKLEKA